MIRQRLRSPESYTPRHLAEKILTSRNALEGERKQVTVLFCDVVESSRLAERLDAEAMHHVMDRILRVMADAVHRYEGTVNQFLGDGVMALFGAPLALEDHAIRAIRAAIAIREGVATANEELYRDHGVQVTLRLGLNTGVVVVGKIGDNLRMDYTAVGDTTHRAARLQQLASPGTILLGDATYRLVEHVAEAVCLGEPDVKGLQRQQVWRLDAFRPATSRFELAVRRGLTPLVGREQELKRLEQAYEEASSGSSRAVNVVGEAGIGKSRLLYELRRRLQHQPPLFLRGSCSSFGRSTSFLPFIEVVRAAFRLTEGESQVDIDAKLRQGLEALGLKAEGAVPLLLNLLGLNPGPSAFYGLDGEIIGARTRDLLQVLLREYCRMSPTVLVIDDLHWTDGASEEVLAQIIRGTQRMPLLVLCAYRPEYQPPWAGAANVTELNLDPLSRDMTVSLVERRVGIRLTSEQLGRLVADRAEGNPLFAEELTRYLQEAGSLKFVETATTIADSNIPVPGTLRDIIMARVDRLEEGPRTLLQTASVIGRRFSVDILQTVSDIDGDLPEYLDRLRSQELVFRRELSGQEFAFKHAMIQDAVYQGLLKSRRETLHRRVADAIETRYPGRIVEWAEVLAHHWSRTPEVDRAVRYIAVSGEKSLGVYAIEEAHARFRQVMELLDAVPGAADDSFVADVMVSWARVYFYRKDFRGLIASIQRYLPRVESLPNRRPLALLLFWLGLAHAVGARPGVARPILERALAVGEAIGDNECIGFSVMGLMWCHLMSHADQPTTALDRLGDRALQLADRLGDVFLATKSLQCLVFDRLFSGRLNDARAYSARLIQLGRSAGDPRALAMGLYTLGVANIFEERYEEAIQNAEESLQLSPDLLDQLSARLVKGIVLVLTGRADEGLEVLRETRRQFTAGDLMLALLVCDLPLGAALVLTGEISRGVRWIEDAIRRFTQWGNRQNVVAGHLMLGEIYLQIATGKKRPPLRTVLKNLGFVIRTVPVAARKTRQHFEEANRRASQASMPGARARSLFGLGLLAAAQKRTAEARRYLEDARQIAEPHSEALSEKIRRSLEALPATV